MNSKINKTSAISKILNLDYGGLMHRYRGCPSSDKAGDSRGLAAWARCWRRRARWHQARTEIGFLEDGGPRGGDDMDGGTPEWRWRS